MFWIFTGQRINGNTELCFQAQSIYLFFQKEFCKDIKLKYNYSEKGLDRLYAKQK